MEENAVDLYCLFGDNSPFYIKRLVTGFIQRYAPNIKKDKINLDKNLIFVMGKEIIAKNSYQLGDCLFEINKLSSSNLH